MLTVDIILKNTQRCKCVNGVKPDAQYGIITSIGHIVIDLEQEEPTVKRVYDNEELIGEFIR